MQNYITWDPSGEYLWLTTPYKNKKTNLWESEYDNPETKVPLPKGTVEFYCWRAVNDPFPRNIYKLSVNELEEIKTYAIT